MIRDSINKVKTRDGDEYQSGRDYYNSTDIIFKTCGGVQFLLVRHFYRIPDAQGNLCGEVEKTETFIPMSNVSCFICKGE
jgi:hypothetical protein